MRFPKLMMPDGAPGGGGAITETPEPKKKSAADAAIDKMFQETATDKPPEGGGNEKPETEEIADGADAPEAKPKGETIDLSKLNADEKTALETRAKQSGVTPEEQFAAEADELKRLEEIAGRTGESLEEIQAREEQGGEEPKERSASRTGDKAGKTFSEEEHNRLVEKAVKSRHKQLEQQVAELQGQLANQSVAGGGLLDRADTPEKVNALGRRAVQDIAKANDWLSDLNDEPDRVREEAQGWLGKDAIPDECEPRVVRKAIREALKMCEAVRDAAPEKLKFFQDRNTVKQRMREPEVVKAAPFIGDEGSEEHEMFKTFCGATQHMKLGELYAAACVIGLRTLNPAIAAMVDRQAGKKAAAPANGKRFIPRVKFPGLNGGARRAATATKQDKLESALL